MLWLCCCCWCLYCIGYMYTRIRTVHIYLRYIDAYEVKWGTKIYIYTKNKQVVASTRYSFHKNVQYRHWAYLKRYLNLIFNQLIAIYGYLFQCEFIYAWMFERMHMFVWQLSKIYFKNIDWNGMYSKYLIYSPKSLKKKWEGEMKIKQKYNNNI